ERRRKMASAHEETLCHLLDGEISLDLPLHKGLRLVDEAALATLPLPLASSLASDCATGEQRERFEQLRPIVHERARCPQPSIRKARHRRRKVGGQVIERKGEHLFEQTTESAPVLLLNPLEERGEEAQRNGSIPLSRHDREGILNP